MGRAPCCSKVGLHRGPWTTREDALLTSYIQNHGEGNWRSLPKLAGLLRCGKSCRLRWMNYLRPDIKRGNITPEEEDLIIRLHRLLGNRWSLIAGRLPGRTDNEIKNYWNSHLSKKLRKQGFVLREAAPRARHLRSPPKQAVENGGQKEGIIYTPKPTRVMSAPLLQANAWSDETEVSANSDWSDAGEFDASNDGFFDAANHDQFLPLQQDEVMLERLFDEYTWLLHSDQMHDCNLFAFEQSLMV